MWQQQPDYARYKEKLGGEGWLVNQQEGSLIQIKPDAATPLSDNDSRKELCIDKDLLSAK